MCYKLPVDEHINAQSLIFVVQGDLDHSEQSHLHWFGPGEWLYRTTMALPAHH